MLAFGTAGAPAVIIEPHAVNLGYILKMVPHASAGMTTFTDRLRLQKSIYMIEAFGVYLGYDFSWYLRGPYCTRLAKAGFELEQIAHMVDDDAKTRFVDPQIQKKFERAVQFIKKVMDSPSDTERLEIAASIHLLSHTTSLAKEDIFSRVMEKMSVSDAQRQRLRGTCESMWKELSKEDLLQNGQ